MSPREFVDDIFATISIALMENKNGNILDSSAKSQIDNIINQFRIVFEDGMEALAILLFPDRVDGSLRKRATVTISPAAFVSWSSQIIGTLDSWVGSPSFKVFACLFESLSANFNVNAAWVLASARLQGTVSVGNSRINAAAAVDTQASAALSRLNASIQSTIRKLREPVDCNPNTSSSGPTSVPSASSASGSLTVSTILTTKTIVVSATSTQIVIVCTKCVETTGSGFTVFTKTNGNGIVTVTEPCIVTYIPDGTSTIYYGGVTKTATEACTKCIGLAGTVPSALTPYSTSNAGIVRTKTVSVPANSPSSLTGASIHSTDGTISAATVSSKPNSPALPISSLGITSVNPSPSSMTGSDSGNTASQSSIVAQANEGVSNSIFYNDLVVAILANFFFILA